LILVEEEFEQRMAWAVALDQELRVLKARNAASSAI